MMIKKRIKYSSIEKADSYYNFKQWWLVWIQCLLTKFAYEKSVIVLYIKSFIIKKEMDIRGTRDFTVVSEVLE